METPKRKNFNTTIRKDFILKLKIMAAEKDVRANDLLEEALQDLFEKHEKEPE